MYLGLGQWSSSSSKTNEALEQRQLEGGMDGLKGGGRFEMKLAGRMEGKHRGLERGPTTLAWALT